MQMERDGLHHPRTGDRMVLGGDGPRQTLERIVLRSLETVSERREFESFRIDVHPERETVRVAPVGELDLATVTPLRERLDELLEPECRSVVLDLRGVTFIDASALHLIVSRNTYARESGIEFAIIQGPPAVRRVFAITGLLDRLPFRAMSAENGGSVRPTTSPLSRMPTPPPQQSDAENASASACLKGVVG
jgi:anti-sigma B factor antagonist